MYRRNGYGLKLILKMDSILSGDLQREINASEQILKFGHLPNKYS